MMLRIDRPQRRRALCSAIAATLFAFAGTESARAQDNSAAPILQMFEARWDTVEDRAVDAFMAGYGNVWIPPTGLADSGGFSVGYDVYDRFDLGTPERQTLYGTETGLRNLTKVWHRFGGQVTADLVWNHNGFSDLGTNGFLESGDYPGFVLTHPNAIDGDFHSGFATGDRDGRLSGLIDIDHATNFQYIRNPVDPGDPRNIPAGTTPYFGKLADVPDASNRRFYPSQGGESKTLFDPITGETFTRYEFAGDGSERSTGTPTTENALGYLQRNAQWLIQDIGIDGFRLDAVKHMEPWVLNYFDRAVHQANPRRLLDGSTPQPFSFGEALDGSFGLINQYVRKDFNPADPNRVAGNRDALDFPLHFALKDNLTGNGFQNDWRNIVSASYDGSDDGLYNNGSRGVAFDGSHDDGGASLGNVSNAYLAMRPGNWIVYLNAEEFGGDRDFPKDGRGDALGGVYGDTITTLVGLRNTHGRGNYHERWIEKETLIYERENSALVGLSNRVDGGFDQRTVATAFAPGTRLLEMTGNAVNDEQVVVVDASGNATIKVPRNGNTGGNGYVIYGLPTPEGTLSLTNVAGVLEGGSPTAGTNGTTRLADLEIITADSFGVRLQTTAVTLPGGYRDLAADGDNALLKINGGLDVNGNGVVDNVSPGSVAYGFESFAGKSSPLATGGDGEFLQSVDSTVLPEGVNFVEVRAFRQRIDGGPAVFTPFKKAIYVDRLAPESEVAEVRPLGPGDSATQQFRVRSVDATANSVHTFLNLGADLDDSEILAMVSGSNAAGQLDRDLFAYGYGNLLAGNQALTVVMFEPTGNYSVRRFGGLAEGVGRGLGVGDLNGDGSFTRDDVFGPGAFEQFLYSQNQSFNPAADVDGDGRIDSNDLFALEPLYEMDGATDAAAEARRGELRRGNLDGNVTTDASDIDALFNAIAIGDDAWRFDLASDGGAAGSLDLDTMIFEVFETAYADANLDGRVDLSDFVLLRNHFGTAAGWAGGDFTGNGIVDLSDFVILRNNFGFGSQDPGRLPTMVPEPGLASVWLLAVPLIFGRKRRVKRLTT